jgi:hypothetical protein
MTDALWTSDFEWAGRRLRVKTTGAEVAIDAAILASFARWLSFYLAVRARQLSLALTDRPAVWFAPERPRPWYLVWAALAWSGLRIARTPDEASVAFYFEDATRGPAPDATHRRGINFGCTDISKSRVAEVFETVFRYPLTVDAERFVGDAVEKSETNGAHDGRVVSCPTRPRVGRVYQRLVDNIDRGEAVDLRTPFVGGRPVVVFVKRRPAAQRFANANTSIRLARPEDVFSAREIEMLSRFATAMRLDWGGLDILRDHRTGLLYVVDVNKTDMPPLALPWLDKLRAVSRLGRALTALISSPETA